MSPEVMTQEVLYLFWFLWGWFGISFLLLLVLFITTPAYTFLRARIFKRPVTLTLLKTGTAKWEVPNKVEEGWAYFKRKKGELGYILSRASTVRVGANNLGIILEERGGYIPPQCFAAAKKLYDAGFDNYTEAEIAYHLHQIEKEHGITIKANTEVEVEEDGKTEDIPIMEYLTAELRRRGINKFVDPEEDIRETLHKEKHHIIEDYAPAFRIMEQFNKYSMNPAAIQDKISAERLYEREKSQIGISGVNKEKAMFFAVVFIVLIVGYVILVQTNALDGIQHWLDGAEGVAQSMPKPTPPSGGSGISVK